MLLLVDLLLNRLERRRPYIFPALLYFFIFSAFAGNTLIIEPDQGRQPLLQAIQEAEATIDLAIYGFTDPLLMQALIQSKEEGKKVRILLQHFPYKNVDENKLVISRFSASHLNVAFARGALLHQKTLILDQHLALVLTFNFTRSSFQSERNFGLLIKDPAMVEEIQRVFNADWQNQKVTPQSRHLVWSPDQSRKKIINLINQAKSTLQLYAPSLSDYEVVGALANSARRGVKVQVLTSDSLSSKKWSYLQKAGVQFAFDHELLIHAKVVIVDQKLALLGSINFTSPSLDKNRELSVLVDEPAVLKKLLQVFKRDWELTYRGQVPP
ncbi:MAG TPA: phospholipase D-like domain-containing protein [Gammaproteobacteria bacterium]|nr:phospholipase D-like domain-containing protein [Gammaproteobacteria bacterium]